MEWITSAVAAFALVVPVELPDKTFVATLVLATRYPPWPVWLGVVIAFGVQSAIAVLAGGLLALLPERPIRIIAAALFAVGAVLLFRGASRADAQKDQTEEAYAERLGRHRSGLGAALFSFLVLFAAEWGDLSQLLTASLVAAGRSPVAVFVGSWAGLALVSAAAVLLGKVLLRRVRLAIVRYVAAGVCAVLAAVTAIAAAA